MLTKKKLILSFLFIFIFSSLLVQAKNFQTAEEFSEYIYENYAQQNFSTVYNHFAAELKRELKLEEYTNFQSENFKKYNLKYQNIKISEAKKVEFKEIKNKFNYAKDFGDYYQLEVSYLLKFDHFGSRERNSSKKIYLRKINQDFQIFWDYESVLNAEENASGEDKDGS